MGISLITIEETEVSACGGKELDRLCDIGL